MKKKIENEELINLIRATLEHDFQVNEILEVRAFDDVDSQDEEILRVEVVFDGSEKAVDAKAVLSAVRHVRPKLLDIGRLAFPLFSFVSSLDRGAKLEPT